MRVTVIGAQGQVARALAERASAEFAVTRLGRKTFDLEAVAGAEHAIGSTQPDIIVNAAAYTDVDGAERASDTAFRVNATGARKVAAAAAALKVPLIHVSTEYVFDGSQAEPYTEADAPAPLNAYGHSKLAGEEAVAAETNDHVILRTSWLYSPYGRNFLTKIRAQLGATAEISVIADRRGAPTSALELARGIEQVARNLVQSRSDVGRGIFHMTCAGETTWAGFAAEIIAQSEEIGGPRPVVRPIASTSLPELARRPINSGLNNDRLASLHGVTLINWKDALSLVMRKLKGDL